ncbi:hypothetical protein BLNAU_2759 [Blattamonas nauphoetae]|uniref:Cyclin-like domain-containing protein n=1 Tax=Blattamonas nauphoetae TaxID=2049346 RepID=A0ABQ9YE96_9EUKA|nr:hypothetical protein BLNAU_2759 [Blattamonas nauphoetae]
MERQEHNPLMHFRTSTHAKHWMFTLDVLEEKQLSLLSPALFTSLEESILRYYCEKKLIECIQLRKYRHKTIAAAITFLKRFFLVNPINAIPLANITAACLFLAGKTEETQIHYSKILDIFKISQQDLFAAEVRVLAASNFNVHIWCIYHTLSGCLKNFTIESSLESQQLSLLSERAKSIVTESLHSNAMFLLSPGQYALCALTLAARELNIPFEQSVQGLPAQSSLETYLTLFQSECEKSSQIISAFQTLSSHQIDDLLNRQISIISGT